MQSSSIPTKFPVVWGSGASSTYVRSIPVTTSNPDEASFTLGWPPATFTPLAGGGSPPDGRDANGLEQEVTAWLQWAQAGAPINYDASFQSSIGGYPKGAVVGSLAVFGLWWVSTAENNTTDPDTGGSGWEPFGPLISPRQGPTGVSSSGSITIPNNVYYLNYYDCCAGGGGGGGSYGASSGGSGGASSPWVSGGFAVLPGDTIGFTVGAGGGGGGSANPATQGGSGGTTQIARNGTPYLTISGGVGGLPGTSGLATSVTAPGSATVYSGVSAMRIGASGQLPFFISTAVASGLGGASGGGGYSALSVSAGALAGQTNPGNGGGGGGGICGGNGGAGGPGFISYGW